MNRRNALTIIPTAFATAAAAACSGYGGPAPARPLAYDVPTPPMATFHMTDTMVVTISTPMGDMAVNNGTDLTLAMTFERAAEGVRVMGSVEHFEASSENPMMGTQSIDGDDVSGTLEYVIGRRGDVEVTSLPELPAAAAQMSPFASLARELLPPLPDAVVEPGGMWVDTVTWTADIESMETTSTGILTYTLVGDTLVEGRTLLNLAVSGEVSADAEGSVAGMAMTQTMAGSTTGFILWDAERGLPAYQSESEMEGSMSAAGMPPFSMMVTGTTTVTLRN
ncbi:MAG: hypothetical protein OXH66_03050 [Gemmatimonadetes bacterium]|nr:hypothetical protein [Gemmatimonadota bacterium]